MAFETVKLIAEWGFSAVVVLAAAIGKEWRVLWLLLFPVLV